MLRAKSLTINDVTDVSGFPDQSSISCVSCLFAAILCFCPPCFCHSLSDGYIYTASEAANDEKEQYVASCCRRVASRKAQQNPCKMGLVAVLPIFWTSIYPSCVSGHSSRQFYVFAPKRLVREAFQGHPDDRQVVPAGPDTVGARCCASGATATRNRGVFHDPAVVPQKILRNIVAKKFVCPKIPSRWSEHWAKREIFDHFTPPRFAKRRGSLWLRQYFF
jgi:hypothetical protein